jgi:hypothetical protein
MRPRFSANGYPELFFSNLGITICITDAVGVDLGAAWPFLNSLLGRGSCPLILDRVAFAMQKTPTFL